MALGLPEGGELDQPIASWLDRPTVKDGLDNIGTQQPCVLVYSQLLPGITNVTDRAWYFGYYPWFIRAFEQRFPNASEAQFRDKLRRSDCLVTLVAERHAIALNDAEPPRHSGACPGTQKLGPAAAQVSRDGGVLLLSAFADRDEKNTKRYFKNALGGLGQYYLGSLRDEYCLLQGDPRKGVKYTLEHGESLATLSAAGLSEDKFFAAIEKDEVSTVELDELTSFCPCSLHEPSRCSAHNALLNLFFNDPGPSGMVRRRTLDLLLIFLSDANGAIGKDPVRAFLHACYSGCLLNGSWDLSDEYERTRMGWAIYARNEMLSLAWIAIFKICLDAMDESNPSPTVNALCEQLLRSTQIAYRPTGSFATLLDADRTSAPAVEAVNHADHEFAIWESLHGSRAPRFEDAARMLVRLVARFGDDVSCYAPAGVPPTAFAHYPLTLDTLNAIARQRWMGLDGVSWLRDLMLNVLIAHQRVAIRKMGQSGEDTLMFRANDRGYFRHRDQETVVATQPRLRQALQILRDLDLIAFSAGRLPAVTPRGFAQLKAIVR